MMNTIIKNKVWVLLLLFVAAPVFSIRVPKLFYFPVSPGFTFSLISERSNTIDVSTRVRLPEDEEASDFIYVFWDIKADIGTNQYFYSLQFTILSNSDGLLSQIGDGQTERMIEPGINVFPASQDFNAVIKVGEDISLKYTRRLGTLTFKDSPKSFTDVLLADFTFGSKTMTLYFAKDFGIIAVKTPEETFKAR